MPGTVITDKTTAKEIMDPRENPLILWVFNSHAVTMPPKCLYLAT